MKSLDTETRNRLWELARMPRAAQKRWSCLAAVITLTVMMASGLYVSQSLLQITEWLLASLLAAMICGALAGKVAYFIAVRRVQDEVTFIAAIHPDEYEYFISHENQVWFQSREEAEAAGYKPTKCTAQALGL